MQHYTYLIIHKQSRMRYIGVRSDNSTVPDILTGLYNTSSSDKAFKQEFTQDRKSFYVRILKFFNTREDAQRHEMVLHHRYEVDINPLFYNRCMSESERFYYHSNQKRGEPMYNIRSVAACYDTGEVILEFPSIKLAAAATGFYSTSITAAASGKQATCGKYNSDDNYFFSRQCNPISLKEYEHLVYWKYTDGNPYVTPKKEKKYPKQRNYRSPIAAFTLDFELIKTFPYANYASKLTGVTPCAITACCRGKITHAGMYNIETKEISKKQGHVIIPVGYGKVVWRYINADGMVIEPLCEDWKLPLSNKPITAYYDDYIEINKFTGVRQAALLTNAKRANIARSATSKTSNAGKYNTQTKQFIKMSRIPPSCTYIKNVFWRFD